jgi:hypothetical protein
MRLAWLPSGGKLIKVPLSFMICLTSSRRSESIQSSLRGKMAVSREMMHLLCGDEQQKSSQSRLHHRNTNLRLTLCNETWKSMSRARCTPKNSPVIKIRFCFARRLRFFWPMTPDSGVGK